MKFTTRFNEDYIQKLDKDYEYYSQSMFDRVMANWDTETNGEMAEHFREFMWWLCEDYAFKCVGLDMAKDFGFAIRDGEF